LWVWNSPSSSNLPTKLFPPFGRVEGFSSQGIAHMEGWHRGHYGQVWGAWKVMFLEVIGEKRCWGFWNSW
jgi:hypothetical protein